MTIIIVIHERDEELERVWAFTTIEAAHRWEDELTKEKWSDVFDDERMPEDPREAAEMLGMG